MLISQDDNDKSWTKCDAGIHHHHTHRSCLFTKPTAVMACGSSANNFEIVSRSSPTNPIESMASCDADKILFKAEVATLKSLELKASVSPCKICQNIATSRQQHYAYAHNSQQLKKKKKMMKKEASVWLLACRYLVDGQLLHDGL